MQVKFLAEGALKNIADKDLGEFANFAFSLDDTTTPFKQSSMPQTNTSEKLRCGC